ncbi:hypothetical protein BXY85_1966 [Roseivirga pacifica]|uniref:Chain length determinant protein n=1 Tax=Roseivirga pacifica TaxID=1267423 RepID=A0A1I0N5V4_9BACT|nr:hypothetical protein [Roseivirga pacifica]RKQ50945.1 hypothetical protein BXY85_1966 [Roseivirga pacifica]SEV96407.1 Chain length determinant protein [Roseivirga pacifica]
MDGDINRRSIDLVFLAKFVLNARKIILTITTGFVLIGIIIALLSPVYFSTNVTFVPQNSGGEKAPGGLSNLAAIAGININGGDASSISPSLYPNIFESVHYQKELLNSEITVHDLDTTVTLFEYYSKFYKPRYGEKFLNYIGEVSDFFRHAIVGSSEVGDPLNQSDVGQEGIVYISKSELEVIRKIKSQVFISVNDLDGYVKISAEMPEALSSAQVVYQAMSILQKKIVAHKIQKAEVQLEFIEQRYQEKLKEFRKVQLELAEFRDRNANISTAIAQTELQVLQSKYDLTYSVFQELAQQLETQRIQVKKDTPLFTIIEQVVVPVERSRPRRAIMVILFGLVGFTLSIVFFIAKYYFLPTEVNKKIIKYKSS